MWTCEVTNTTLMNTLLPLCILSLLCTQDGDTPLHLAAWKRNVESVKLLVQNGANVQIANKASYCSPIHCCCDLYLQFSAFISCVPGVIIHCGNNEY